MSISILGNVGNAGFALPMVQAYPNDVNTAQILSWDPAQQALAYLPQDSALAQIIAATVFNTLAQTTGASYIGYIQGSQGSVLRNLQTKTRETLTVTDFYANGINGAVVDSTGTVNSTQGIIKALEAAAGKVLIFPPGVYLVDGTLLKMYAGTVIFGYGATLKLMAGSYTTTAYFLGTNTGITYDSNFAVVPDVEIHGLAIDGNINNVVTSDSCYGINLYRTLRGKVVNVDIKNLPGVIGGGYGIAASFSQTVSIDGCSVDRTDRQNVIIWETKDAHITKCTLKDSYFRDCILVSSNTPAVFQASDCGISGTYCLNSLTTGTHVVRFSGESSGSINNCRLVGPGAGSTLQGIYITDIYPKRISINNTWIDNVLTGVELSSDAAHDIECIGVHVGSTTPCANGMRFNSNLANVRIVGGSINATTQPLYMNAVDYQSVVGMDISGGTLNSAVFSEAAGTTIFLGNTVRNNTNASYPILFAGAGEPIIGGNKTLGNTVNLIRATTGAVVSGNSNVQIDGTAKSGTVVKRSTTANRPTGLGAADIGISFLDTTLAANGKPIWWTGTIWVDSLGAAV